MSQKDSTDEVVKDWFGQLPEGWSLRRLRTLGRFSSSGIDKKTVEGEPLVRMVNYTDVYGNSTHELRNSPDYMVVSCPANKVEEHGLVQGDMLLTPSSETPEDIGVSAVVMEDLDNTVYSYHITRFRMRDEVSLRYRKYLCNHPRVLRQFSRLCKGTTRQILVREDFKSAWVAVPPPDQHDRIAAYLDAATGKIDRLMSLRRRQMDLLREQRAALIQQAVTRGLNPRAPLKDSGLPWLGQIPTHWTITQVKRGAVIISKGSTPSTIGSEFVESGVRFLKAENILNGTVLSEPSFFVDEATHNSMRRSHLQPNDLLVVIAGATTGKAGVLPAELTPANANQAVCFVRFRDAQVSSFCNEWLALAPVRDLMLQKAVQSAQPNLAMPDLGAVPIVKIPREERAEILTLVGRIKAQSSKIIASYERQLALLAEYRASLIHECVTGQRPVPN